MNNKARYMHFDSSEQAIIYALDELLEESKITKQQYENFLKQYFKI